MDYFTLKLKFFSGLDIDLGLTVLGGSFGFDAVGDEFYLFVLGFLKMY